MTYDNEDSERLTEVSALSRETPPPVGLENEIVDALAARGLLVKKRTGRWWIPALAAGIVLFVVGYTVGVTIGLPSQPVTSEFALLLYDGADFIQAPAADPDLHARTYGAWGAELAERGALVGAGELGEQRWLLTRDQATDEVDTTRAAASGQLSGFFLIRSQDVEGALSIAQTHPHLLNLGQIELREIVTR